MLTKEIAQEIHRHPLAHFPKHPADGLMHQVVRMVEMDLGIAQAPRGIAHLRGLPRADDAHALFPQAGADSQFVEHVYLIVPLAESRWEHQPVAKYLWCRQIYQVPVVGLLGIFQIEHQDFVPFPDSLRIIDEPFRCLSLEMPDEYQQSAEPHFMPRAHQQSGYLAQWCILRYCFHHFSRLWHLHAQELITIAVLPRSRLEKSHQHLPLRLVLKRLHVLDDLSCSHLAFCIVYSSANLRKSAGIAIFLPNNLVISTGIHIFAEQN